MTLTERIEATTASLTNSANLLGFAVTGDGRVCERDATVLIGWATGSLKNKRQAGSGPAAYNLGCSGGRISYRIADLAAWIEGAREFY